MVLLGESRTPSTAGTLISPAANIAHGFLWYFSCDCSEGSCCFQDTGVAVWATVFPAAVPVWSEVGSPNSAAGKERSDVSTSPGKHSSSYSPSNSPTLGVQFVGTRPVTQSTGIYANLWHAIFCEKTKLPSGSLGTANRFVTIGLFLCARHRKWALSTYYRMFLLLQNNTFTFQMCHIRKPNHYYNLHTIILCKCRKRRKVPCSIAC